VRKQGSESELPPHLPAVHAASARTRLSRAAGSVGTRIVAAAVHNHPDDRMQPTRGVCLSLIPTVSAEVHLTRQSWDGEQRPDWGCACD